MALPPKNIDFSCSCHLPLHNFIMISVVLMTTIYKTTYVTLRLQFSATILVNQEDIQFESRQYLSLIRQKGSPTNDLKRQGEVTAVLQPVRDDQSCIPA